MYEAYTPQYQALRVPLRSGFHSGHHCCRARNENWAIKVSTFRIGALY